MARNSFIGNHDEGYIYKLLNKIRSNRCFLNKQDIEVLEFLSKKGDFEDKEVAIVNKINTFV